MRGNVSLEESLYKRRSHRYFAEKQLELSQLSQILWAAQGITDKRTEHRAAPSAGETYPLEIFAVAGNDGVADLEAGLYLYIPSRHSLELRRSGDLRDDLARYALNQKFISITPVSLVLCGVIEKTAWHYGQRARRYVYMETGHAGQNIYLQAGALGLGTVAIGAFNDEMVGKLLELAKDTVPLYIMPVGTPARSLGL